MSDFTATETQLLRFAWHDATCPEGTDCRDRNVHSLSNGVILGLVAECLAAVLPAHDKRVRAEALREAADEWEFAYTYPDVLRWLRARADAEEGK